MDRIGDLQLPTRLIAFGEEPLGERVNFYSKTKTLCSIIDALNENDKKSLRCTQFGKLLDFPNQPSFSATFGIYILGRQLDVAKSYEIWIVFAGTPIRFSLREFKLVTGLRCGKYPTVQKKRKKNTAGKKIPYYSTLFGLEEDVTVERVITMLKKNIVTDEETRLRFAVLALVDGYILPTSHYPKILKEHAEKCEDIEAFMSYPWGRKSFESMVTSIKERDVHQLATTCVSVQGLVYALQLVVLLAAPSIQDAEVSDYSVGNDSEEDSSPEATVRQVVPFKLGNAKEIDEKCTAKVQPIICPDVGPDVIPDDITWSEEEEDPRVDNILRLAREGYKFTNDMFRGGIFPSEMEVVPKKQKKTVRGKAVRSRKGSKAGKNQTCTRQSCSIQGDAPGSRFFDTNAFSRLLADKLAASEKRIIDGVISWFEHNVSVSGEKGGTPQDGDDKNCQNSNGSPLRNKNVGGRGYVFSESLYPQGGTRGEVNQNPCVFGQEGVGIHDYVGEIEAFYGSTSSPNRNNPSPSNGKECDVEQGLSNLNIQGVVNLQTQAPHQAVDDAPHKVPYDGNQGNVATVAVLEDSHNGVNLNKVATSLEKVAEVATSLEKVAEVATAFEKVSGGESSNGENSDTSSEVQKSLKDYSEEAAVIGGTIDKSLEAESVMDEEVENEKDGGVHEEDDGGDDESQTDNRHIVDKSAEEGLEMSADDGNESNAGGEEFADMDVCKDVTTPHCIVKDPAVISGQDVGREQTSESRTPLPDNENSSPPLPIIDDKNPTISLTELAESTASCSRTQTKVLPMVKLVMPSTGDSSQIDSVVGQTRRSMRTRTISSKLDSRYHFDRKTKALVGYVSPITIRPDPEERFQNSMKKLKAKSSISLGGDLTLTYKDAIDLIDRSKPMTSKVMDGLIKFSRHLLRTDDRDGVKLRVDVLDSKFVGGLNRLYAKFKKHISPEAFIFPTDLIDDVVGGGDPDRVQLFTQADYVYMPFNFEKKHWVSLCVDFQGGKIVVLDSNFRMRSDANLKIDIKPIAVMLPYLLIQADMAGIKGRLLPTEFTIERPLRIPQVASHLDSGIMSIFLIHAHSIGGLEECFDFDVLL